MFLLTPKSQRHSVLLLACIGCCLLGLPQTKAAPPSAITPPPVVISAKKERERPPKPHLAFSRWDKWFDLTILAGASYAVTEKRWSQLSRIRLGASGIHNTILHRGVVSFGTVVESEDFSSWGLAGYVEYISLTRGLHASVEVGAGNLASWRVRASVGWSLLSLDGSVERLKSNGTFGKIGFSLRVPISLLIYGKTRTSDTFSIPLSGAPARASK